MKRVQKNGLVWYESEGLNELGVRHGFFTRLGGVSKQPFDSLNVKYDIDDSTESVRKNRARILDVLDTDTLRFAKLKHGAEFSNVSGSDSHGVKDVEAVDGLITDQKNIAIGLSVADCLPIIVSDGKLLGIIHAGWRGTVAGITSNVVKGLINKGFNLETAVAATGPCICSEHFEVRDEAAEQLRKLAGERLSSDPYHADLESLNKKQLRDSGISQIDNLSICSYESDEFYSHRRDHGKTGRNMSVALLQ
jgi:YfiH family protein